MDGLYVIRTPVPASQLGAPAAVTAYKNLSRAKRDRPYRSFHGLLEHLATLTRNQVRFGTRARLTQAKDQVRHDIAYRTSRNFGLV
jgi:hypothetical protein